MGKLYQFPAVRKEYESNVSETFPEPIHIEEGALRRRYTETVRQEELTRQAGHQVLNEDPPTREVASWRGKRKVNVSLDRVSEELKTLQKERDRIDQKLWTTPDPLPNDPEHRSYSRERYGRTEAWKKRRGYI